MCQRFGCLPSQLLDEDAGLLRYMTILQLGGSPVLRGEQTDQDYPLPDYQPAGY